MRKKLIDSTKADIKKYMMIVESAGKVPASTREDFTLEDIENPYFQGDEDTEESEGNRYYVTVGVKIGYDENTDSYFPEVIWDQETGTEIEFDKLDKISKKSIQEKCHQIGSKIHVQRKGVNESTQIVVKALMQKFKISESKAKSIVAKVSESLVYETNDSEEQTVDVFVKHPVTKKPIEVSVLFMPIASGGYKIVEVSDVMTGVVYKLQSFDSSSVNKINTEIQTVLDDSVSESLKHPISESLFGKSDLLKRYGEVSAQAKKIGLALSKNPQLLSSGTLVIPITKGKIDFRNNLINTLAANGSLDQSLTKLSGMTVSRSMFSGKPKEIFAKLVSLANEKFEGTEVKSINFTLGANEFSGYEFSGTAQEELTDKAKELMHPHLH